MLSLPIHAENFTYDFHVDNPTPYKHEPILLSVDINQTNPEVVLFFNFAVKESKNYRAVQIDSVQDTTLHHSYIHYLYVVYPLREGDIDIGFDLVERVTDEHKVAYSFSGDRDDFKKLETKDRAVTVPPVHLQAKPLPAKTQLTGDFKLSYEIRQHEAEAYEPINMKVVITGEGYPPVLEHIFPQEGNITFFRQPPEIKRFPSKKGITYRVTYTLAVSHAESFDLSALALHAFNPRTETSYLLEIPEQHFEIHHKDRSVLLDAVDNPLPFHLDFSWFLSFLGYLIVFAAGYLSAHIVKRKKHARAPGGTLTAAGVVYKIWLRGVHHGWRPLTLGQPMEVALATDSAPKHPQLGEVAIYRNGSWTRMMANYYRASDSMVLTRTKNTHPHLRAVFRTLQARSGPEVERGRELYTDETWGDEAIWGDFFELHKVLNNVTPNMAVGIGAQVDISKVPQFIVDVMLSDDFAAKRAALDDPAVAPQSPPGR